MAAWGLWLPFWMKASWFKKHGYKTADRDSIRVLVWKPFDQSANPPKWIREKKRPTSVPGKVTVTSFVNGWCQAQNLVFERAKSACECFGKEVDFQMFDTSRRETMLEWGISDGLFIDGKPVRTGPPPSEEKIRKKIAGRVKRLGLRV